jgi:hypothetical protein
MKTADWELGRKHGSGAMYRLACSCGTPEHDCVIMFELEDGIAQVDFYKKMTWCPWYKDNWFLKIWERIKAATKLLFTGWIEIEEEFIVDRRYIPDIIKVFQESEEMLNEYEKQWQEQQKIKQAQAKIENK